MLHTYGLRALLCMCPTNNNKGQQTTTNDKPWNSDYANELFPILVANCRGSILFIMPITVQRHQAHQPVLVLLFVLAITQTQQAGQDPGEQEAGEPHSFFPHLPFPRNLHIPSLGSLSLLSLSLPFSLTFSRVLSGLCKCSLCLSFIHTLPGPGVHTHTCAHPLGCTIEARTPIWALLHLRNRFH